MTKWQDQDGNHRSVGDPQAVRPRVAKEPCEVVLSLAPGDAGCAWARACREERGFLLKSGALAAYNQRHWAGGRLSPSFMPKGRGWDAFLSLFVSIIWTQTWCHTARCGKCQVFSHIPSRLPRRPLETTSALLDFSSSWKLQRLDSIIAKYGSILQSSFFLMLL